MRFTSITHCGASNFQSDFIGTTDQALRDYAQWCAKREAVWGHLFEEKTGRLVASYNVTSGITKLS